MICGCVLAMMLEKENAAGQLGKVLNKFSYFGKQKKTKKNHVFRVYRQICISLYDL